MYLISAREKSWSDTRAALLHSRPAVSSRRAGLKDRASDRYSTVLSFSIPGINRAYPVVTHTHYI